MRLSICSFVLFSLLALPLSATTVQRLDLAGLVGTAHAIVVGTVLESATCWSPDGRLILTRHTLQVSETLKGTAGGMLDVTTIGGTIGDQTLYVSGMPVFTTGEEAVVFLELSGRHSTVVGMGQGKFSVVDGFVANSIAGLEFARRAPASKTRMEVAKFRSEIQRLQATKTR